MRIFRSLLVIIFSTVGVHPVAQVRMQEMSQIALTRSEGNRSMEARQAKLLFVRSPEGSAWLPANFQAASQQAEMAHRESGFHKVHLGRREAQIQAVGGNKTAACVSLLRRVHAAQPEK